MVDDDAHRLLAVVSYDIGLLFRQLVRSEDLDQMRVYQHVQQVVTDAINHVLVQISMEVTGCVHLVKRHLRI
jgi:hypothetical protein